MPSKAKQQAIKDIREQLANEQKEFIEFRPELNDTIRQIVRQHLNEQRKSNKR